MKKSLGVLAIALMASSVFAANFIIPGNPAYEPFANATGSGGTSYAVGSELPGQTNAQGLAWVLAGASSNLPVNLPAIASGTLSYPGLLADTGNSVAFGGTTAGSAYARWDLNSTISGSTNQTLYYSMLFDTTNIGTLPGTGVFVCGFNNSTGPQSSAPTTIGARLYMRTNGAGGYNLGINKADGTAGDIAWDSVNCSLNTTYFVVGSYNFSGAPSAVSDGVSLWINPATNTFGGSAPTADATTTNGANIVTGSSESIASFLLRQNNNTEPYVVAANLSVGLTWADITPLPAGALVPVFSNLHSTNTTFGTSVILSGTVSAPGPTYPTNGDTVTVSVNGNQSPGTINDSTGDFSVNFNPGNTPVSPTPYTVTYLYGGSPVLAAATNTSTTLAITNPLPVVLSGSRPADGTATVAAGTLYVSNAVGSDDVFVASGTGTLAGSAAGVQPITSFGSLTLGGTTSNNYTLTGASGAVTIVTNPILAGHPIFDPFNDATASNGTSYAVNANLAGQTNAQGYAWFAAGSGGGGQPMIQSGALTVPGLIAVSTNSVTYGGAAGISTRLDLGPTGSSSTFVGNTGVTLYYSMALDVTVPGSLSTTNPAFIAGFNNSAGAQTGQPSIVGARLYARLDGSGYDLGIDKDDSTTSNIVWEPNPYNLNTTYFIVAAYTFSGSPGATNDTVSLWVNPPTNTFGGTAPAPDVTTSIGGNMGSTSPTDVIASFLLREAVATEPAVMAVDDVSVGVTWADVTPTGNASSQLAPFRILSRSVDNTHANFILTWQSVPGSHYQVIGSPTVSAARSTWTNVGSQITATGTNTSATNPITSTRNFFGVTGH
jgi:hypothetical protein